MKDPKIEALIQFLGFKEADYGRFTQSDYNPNIYIIDDGKEIKSCYQNNEFLVCTDQEADAEHHEAFMNLVEEMGLTSFTDIAQEYILNNCLNPDMNDWFDLAFDESTRGYAEDIASEENKAVTVDIEDSEGDIFHIQITNRLMQECLEENIIDTSDLSVSDFDVSMDKTEYTGDLDLVELYCEHFDTASKAGYEDAVDWYRQAFGKDAFQEAIQAHNIIDWDKVEKYCKEEDGRGNELNRWDGQEYEEEIDGETYYIYPDCDFKELESVKAEKEDIDR